MMLNAHAARLLLSLAVMVLGACGRAESPPPVASDEAAPPAGSSERARPNVVILLADDLGWGDTGYNGHPVLKTPNLDALAADGLRFDRFYAATPVCAPTRASVLTARHGIRQGLPLANGGHLREQERTIAELFGDAGYMTGHFGKWHMGTLTPEFTIRPGRVDPVEDHTTPSEHGFDEWFATESSVATWDPYDPANAPNSFEGMGLEWDRRAFYWHNGELVQEDLTGDDSAIIMDRVLPFIDRAAGADRPFCALVWFHAPHSPVVAGPEWRAMYPGVDEDTQHYYGVVSALDAQVGRLREHLQATGLADDTIIWFCSDNGPEGMPGPRDRTRGSAGPFRGRKRSLYEGGIRVPSALVWPGEIEAGRTTDAIGVTSDMLPTLLSLAGAGSMPDRPADGVDLTPLARGEAFERPGPLGFQFQTRAAMVGARYKLVVNESLRRHPSDNGRVPVRPLELYDLIDDPGETRDVAAEHPEVVERLKTGLDAWLASCAASDVGADYEPAGSEKAASP